MDSVGESVIEASFYLSQIAKIMLPAVRAHIIYHNSANSKLYAICKTKDSRMKTREVISFCMLFLAQPQF